MSDVQGWIDRFLADLEAARVAPVSVVLYGSAARGQHLPGWSDVNVALILDTITLDELDRLRRPFARWRGDAVGPPLLLTRAEWSRAADAYPLEIAEMRTAYRVLQGADPFTGLVVQPDDLRLALERELRGKLLRLRQAYALMGDDPRALADFVRRSVSSILFLLRGLVVLAGRTPALDPVELANDAGAIGGFEGGPVARVVARRTQADWRCTHEEFRGYLAAVERAAEFVDHFQTGGHA